MNCRERGAQASAFAALLAALLTGCASTPPPDAQRLAADAALAQAREADAEEHAPLELRFAREKLAAAQGAEAERDFEQAARLYEQARINGELAVAKTAAAKARDAVRRQQAENDALRAELELDAGAGS